MPFDNDAWMRKLGSLPLLAQPGEDWLYGTGSNVQGVLVARASGKPLSRFFEERIFGPLGMKDTAFVVPPAEIDRLAHAYRSQDGKLVVSDEPATGKWSRPPAFEPGAGGLVSTADDYLAFARMLLADGKHQGQALLAPASVKAMKTDHLTAEQRAGGEMILGRGRGWGYGVSVVTAAVPSQLAPGTFGCRCWAATGRRLRFGARRRATSRRPGLPGGTAAPAPHLGTSNRLAERCRFPTSSFDAPMRRQKRPAQTRR